MSFAYTLQSSELMSLGMPDFPVENLKYIVTIMVSLTVKYTILGLYAWTNFIAFYKRFIRDSEPKFCMQSAL